MRYGFGALDVHKDRLRLRLMRRRRGQDTPAFMRQIRLCYPRRVRLYWIQDNLSANWTPEIRTFATENNIELVPLPTLDVSRLGDSVGRTARQWPAVIQRPGKGARYASSE